MQFPVEASPVLARRVEVAVTGVGTVEAFEQVQVTARVPGAIEEVRFAEGDLVKKGAALAEIEPDRYRLAAQSARATLERAEASRSEVDAALARRETLEKRSPGTVKEEDLASFRARARITAAEVAQARASLDLAELNLREAVVRVPLSGILQTRTVQTGQYVQAGAVLATLVRRDPLLLRFRVQEHEAPRLRRGMRAYFTLRGTARELSADVAHVADAADPATRMVAVTARIAPSADEARPGAFAEVRVPIEGAVTSPVVPQTAVRPSERGFLAYVVEEGLARERVLSVGMRTTDGFVEVRSGLSPGELLVVRGGEALREGAAVRVARPEEAAAPAEGREPKGAPPGVNP
jgi:RND family efflux transporter MFP subunit